MGRKKAITTTDNGAKDIEIKDNTATQANEYKEIVEDSMNPPLERAMQSDEIMELKSHPIKLVRSMMSDRHVTFKDLAEMISEKYPEEKTSASNLANKLYKGTIRYYEMEMVTDVLGYDIYSLRRDENFPDDIPDPEVSFVSGSEMDQQARNEQISQLTQQVQDLTMIVSDLLEKVYAMQWRTPIMGLPPQSLGKQPNSSYYARVMASKKEASPEQQKSTMKRHYYKAMAAKKSKEKKPSGKPTS